MSFGKKKGRSAWAAALTERVTHQSDVAKIIRKTFDPLEDAEQTAYMDWAGLYPYEKTTLSEFIHHSPNGGHRPTFVTSKGLRVCPEGAKLKQMGTKAGFPDLEVFVAHGGYFGLYIEMKKKRGPSARQNQRQVHALLRSQGYLVLVCHGADAAIKATKRYMAMPKTVTVKMEWIDG